MFKRSQIFSEIIAKGHTWRFNYFLSKFNVFVRKTLLISLKSHGLLSHFMDVSVEKILIFWERDIKISLNFAKYFDNLFCGSSKKGAATWPNCPHRVMFGQIQPRFGLKIGVQNHKKFELGARFYAYRQKVLDLHVFGRIMMIKIMKLFQENFKVFTEHLRNRVRSSDTFWGFVLILSLILFILTSFIL